MAPKKITAAIKAKYNIKRNPTVTGKRACGECVWWQNRQRKVEQLDHLLDLAQIQKIGMMEEIASLKAALKAHGVHV